jgi:hypothetical protein
LPNTISLALLSGAPGPRGVTVELYQDAATEGVPEQTSGAWRKGNTTNVAVCQDHSLFVAPRIICKFDPLNSSRNGCCVPPDGR